MPRYRYRTLRVRTWDYFNPDHQGSVNLDRRRGGDKPDRILMVTDSDTPEQIRFPDEKGDDWHAFRHRAHLAFVGYLNTLGEGGWQVIAFDRESPL